MSSSSEQSPRSARKSAKAGRGCGPGCGPGPAESAAVPITNDRDQIDSVREQIVEAVERFGYPEASSFAIRLAVEEAISNAFRHGHRDLPDTATVRVEYAVDAERVEVAVEDSGPGFDPGVVPDPTLEENIERVSGRGLMLMRAYMASVEHNERGNRVRMRYQRPPEA